MAKIKVDFTDTEGRTGGPSFHFPPSDYAVQVIKAETGHSKEKHTPQLTFTLQVTSGEFKGKKIRYDCYLVPQSLWTLRNLLEAAGKKVPTGQAALDTEKMRGLKFAVTIEDDEYNGKVRSRVTDTFPLSELAAASTKEADEDLTEDEDTETEDEDTETEVDDDEVEDVDLEDI